MEQSSLRELIGEVDWLDVGEIGVHLLPETVGPRPERGLLESVRQLGILTPILLLDSPGEFYIVIDGNRRIAAAREVGLTSLPARVGTGGKGSLSFALSLISNEQRSSNPVAEYDSIRALVGSWEMNESEIAKALGIPVARVRKRMKLSDLTPYWLEKFRSGKLATSLAESVAKLPQVDQEWLFGEVEAAGKRMTHDLIREVKSARRDSSSSSLIPGLDLGSPNGDRPQSNGTRIAALASSIREELGRGGDDLIMRIDRSLAELEALAVRLEGSENGS
jgi:ParB/RepB/Spo0J family partition protein